MTEIKGFEHNWIRINASYRETPEGPSISIEIFARTPRNRWVECARFDCVEQGSHYHLFARHGGDEEIPFGEQLALSAAAAEALHILATKGLEIIASAGYDTSAATCARSDWSAFINSLATEILHLESDFTASA